MIADVLLITQLPDDSHPFYGGVKWQNSFILHQSNGFVGAFQCQFGVLFAADHALRIILWILRLLKSKQRAYNAYC